jgi:hypothetical protein
MNKSEMETILRGKFDNRRASRLVSHFSASVSRFVENDHEGSLEKIGKAIEATVKLLCDYAGVPLPKKSRNFRAGEYAQKLINVPEKNLKEDSLRRQIPRACIFIYDIVSNRGGRHDSEEIDPNEMDATTALNILSWILAELIRYCSKSLNMCDTEELVNSLIERKYPVFDAIDDRIYLDRNCFTGMLECSVLALYHFGDRRISKAKLAKILKINGIKQTAINWHRLEPFVDINENGDMKLHKHGKGKAEKILQKSFRVG